ncbi:MAG: cytochrome C biogenesis protein [Gemmatimonadetes bacterium]|nr:cytochrome C biogenesis protein [Gemmatimonadota bacterium]
MAIPEFGQFLLYLSFALIAYGTFASLISAMSRRMDMTVSAERAIQSTFLLIGVAFLLLEYLFLTDRFDVYYVAKASSRDLHTGYKLTAIWSSMEGSLLLWSLVVAVYSYFAVRKMSGSRGPMSSYAMSVLGATQLFFLGVVLFMENPFLLISDVENVPVGFKPPDGQGMNPLLVHPAMAIHPPILYAGYVGFVVPFAYAIGALASKHVDAEWIQTTRRWTLIPWFLLGVGQLLGGKWAYVVLGWGGYWGWDPVENAALLPWLTATAYLHSVMIQEKKGMLKVWNMVLILLTYTLCLFGTFLTRSGVVSSVHTFAQSPIGPFFLGAVIVTASVGSLLLYLRYGMLKSETHYDSPVSREGGFLLNNLLFLGAMFAVLWGTMFPVISEAVTGSKITVGPPFFNTVMIPIGLVLMLLTGVGPLLAWRKTSTRSLKRHFTMPTVVSLITVGTCAAFGMRDAYATISFALCAFVTVTIFAEYHRGAVARGKSSDEPYLLALWTLFGRNKRRYGGYIVHFGFVLMFIGFTGNAFNQQTEVALRKGESFELGGYKLTYEGYDQTQNPLTVVIETQLGVYTGQKRLGTLFPEQHVYYKRQDQQRTTEVAIRSNLREDLYILYEGMNDQDQAFFTAYVNPLVMWVWIGCWVMTFGMIVVIWPDKKRPIKRRSVGLRETRGREAVA